MPAAELEVPSPPGVAEVPTPAEVEVPSPPSAIEVPMPVAEPGAGEVPLGSVAPTSLTPPSSMLRPFLARPFSTAYTNVEQTRHKLAM